MKTQRATSKLATATAVSLLVMSFTATAELKIQNAQYKAEKGVLYVKGKLSDSSANSVYVVNADTDDLIDSVNTKGKQFRADLPVSVNNVPCMVQIQTNEPNSGGGDSWWGGSSTNSDPGEFNVSRVRHAPDHCSN